MVLVLQNALSCCLHHWLVFQQSIAILLLGTACGLFETKYCFSMVECILLSDSKNFAGILWYT